MKFIFVFIVAVTVVGCATQQTACVDELTKETTPKQPTKKQYRGWWTTV